MLERHEREQYFWDEATIDDLANRMQRFVRPCCLCAPLLGRELQRRGVECRTLDIDERFAAEPGFSHFDLYRPQWRDETFDAIICDPPFWKVSLSQLFRAVRVLSHHNWQQPLAICYPARRAANLCATFARFELQASGVEAKYQTAQIRVGDGVEFFSNFEL